MPAESSVHSELAHPPAYLPTLDGVRALAIGLVLLFHWHGKTCHVSFGWVGVNLFFVLSGFLITRILIYQKETQSLKTYFLHFYQNRTLRIFPLYYMYLLVLGGLLWFVPRFFNVDSSDLWAKNIEGYAKNVGFLFTYTYNFIFWIGENGQMLGQDTSFTGPLWTLAIEEQFYIVFPFIIWVIPKKWLPFVLLTFFGIAPIFRWLWATSQLAVVQVPFKEYIIGEQIYKFTFLQYDGLVLGAFLALVESYISKVWKWTWLLLGLGVLAVLFFEQFIFILHGKNFGYTHLGLEYPGHWLVNKVSWKSINLRYTYNYTLITIGAACLICWAITQSQTGSWLRHPFLLNIGKISYGMYLLHQPMLFLMEEVWHSFPEWATIKSIWWVEMMYLAFYLSVVYGICWLSYHYLERWFLQFKVSR